MGLWVPWPAGAPSTADMENLWMMVVLISYTQIRTKVTTQLRDANEKKKNGPEKTTKVYFTVILRAILHKEGTEK